MLAVVIDLLFIPILLGVLVAYRRERGTIQRFLVLIFVTLMAFFLRDLLRRWLGTVPTWANDLTLVVQLAQGWVTLLLISRLRPVSRWLLRVSAAAFLVSVVLVCAAGSPLPAGVAGVVFGLAAAFGLIASGLLVADARVRTGSARVRLALAALATTEIYTLSLHDALPIFRFDRLRSARG